METSKWHHMRDYAWNYFEYHAEQRLRSFRLYLILVAVDIATLGTIIRNDKFEECIWVFGIALCVLSWLFWKLDLRNKQLVRNGEEALKYLDEQEFLEDCEDGPHKLKIFARDDFFNSGKKHRCKLDAPLTYSAFYAIIFLFIGIMGISLFVVGEPWRVYLSV